MQDYPIHTDTLEHSGHTITLQWYQDTDHGTPWENEDGHGPVTPWETRDKGAGERILCSDGRCRRFYDFQQAIAIAKRDGWGLAESDIEALSRKLGRTATRGDIVAESVERDFRHLQAWCNDQWHYVGYMATITDPDGVEMNFRDDSLWGIDSPSMEYFRDECFDIAKGEIDAAINGQIARARDRMDANRETLKSLRQSIRALASELKSLCPSPMAGSYPAASQALRQSMASMLGERSRIMEENRELAESL